MNTRCYRHPSCTPSNEALVFQMTFQIALLLFLVAIPTQRMKIKNRTLYSMFHEDVVTKHVNFNEAVKTSK